MLTKQTIEQIVASQKERLEKMDQGLLRNLPGMDNLSSLALIITGIRRCGKSTLLQQINSTARQPSVYLNFEDPRLAGFDLNDFNRLHEIAEKMESPPIFSTRYNWLTNGKVLSGSGWTKGTGYIFQAPMPLC